MRPGVDAHILNKMWSHLVSSCRFDFVVLNHLRPDANIHALRTATQTSSVHLRDYHRRATSHQLVSTASTGAAWFDSHAKKIRQNYRRGRKILEDNAALTFRLLAPEESLEPAIERLAELKRLWLARQGLDAPLFAKGSRLLPALIHALEKEGVLRIFVLERNSRIIAISVNCEHRGEMAAFLTSYDPEFERGSPGVVLMMDYVKWSIDRGLKTVDFLRGDEPFKTRLATDQITLGSMVGARTVLGKAALTLDTFHHWLKY
jgi:CelD/BcsL family acetyltransferase involved in cellulose biosynthesis